MTKIKYQTTQNNDQSTDTHQKTVPLIAEKIMSVSKANGRTRLWSNSQTQRQFKSAPIKISRPQPMIVNCQCFCKKAISCSIHISTRRLLLICSQV